MKGQSLLTPFRKFQQLHYIRATKHNKYSQHFCYNKRSMKGFDSCLTFKSGTLTLPCSYAIFMGYIIS